MDERLDYFRQPEPESQLGSLLDFAEEYIKEQRETKFHEPISARDFRWAAMELGFTVEHSEALLIIERIEQVVFASKMAEVRDRYADENETESISA